MFHHVSLSNPDLSVPFVTFLPALALRQSIRFRWKAQTLFQHLSFCSLAAQLKGQVLIPPRRAPQNRAVEAKISSFPYFLHIENMLSRTQLLKSHQFSSIIWFCISCTGFLYNIIYIYTHTIHHYNIHNCHFLLIIWHENRPNLELRKGRPSPPGANAWPRAARPRRAASPRAAPRRWPGPRSRPRSGDGYDTVSNH